MIRSIHNPEFQHLTDDEVIRAFIDAEVKRTHLQIRADDGEAELWEEIDKLESALFFLDDELCARDLPIPRTGA